MRNDVIEYYRAWSRIHGRDGGELREGAASTQQHPGQRATLCVKSLLGTIGLWIGYMGGIGGARAHELGTHLKKARTQLPVLGTVLENACLRLSRGAPPSRGFTAARQPRDTHCVGTSPQRVCSGGGGRGTGACLDVFGPRWAGGWSGRCPMPSSMYWVIGSGTVAQVALSTSPP